MRARLILLVVVATVGCKKAPPPAPEGVDASSRWLVRNFYADDPTFQAGVQGLMDWYAKDGVALMAADTEATAYTIADLTDEDVALLPLSKDVLVDPDTGETVPRHPEDAGGIVSLAEMDCPWTRAEELMLMSDQERVFPDDWEAYTRHYDTPEDTFRAGEATSDYAPIDAPLDPFAAGFDASAYGSALLMTTNDADPAPAFFGLADIAEFPLFLDARHTTFDLDGEPTSVFSIMSYTREASWGTSSSNALLQTYSVEINVQRPGDKTLRVAAVWTYPFSKVLKDLDPESDVAINGAVVKSRASSDWLAAVCAGTADLADAN